MRKLAIILLGIMLCIDASAQFTTYGTDPWSVRWRQSGTKNFKLIYPAGMDSLAFSYGRALEYYRPWNALSSGFLIGQNYKSKLPVIIHGYNTINNGAVVWAPKRLLLFPVPDPYSPTAMPSIDLLAIHEGRHAAQMQFGKQGRFKVGHVLMGEMFAGALAGLYPGQTLLEGDAVVAETALTRSGRGRQAEFMNYMMPAFDCGDWRDYWQWTYGGQREYAPDYYRVGYMLVSGMRAFYDDPTFTSDYFKNVTRSPGFFKLQKTVRRSSGERFKNAFRNIQNEYTELWTSEASARAPFDPMRQITPKPRLHTEYGKGTAADDLGIFCIAEGLDRAATLTLVRPDGAIEPIRPFGSHTSNLFYDPALKRVYWTETIYSHRWSLKADSRIRYFEISDPGHFKTLTKNGRFFNCGFSDDGSKVISIEYTDNGSSRLCIFDSSNGELVKSFDAPDSLQITEATFLGDKIYALGLSKNGFGIYEISSKAEFSKRLGPQPVSMCAISEYEGKISFESDRTGVGEFYVWDPDGGTLTQMTSSRYGVADVSVMGDSLYFDSVASSDDPGTYRQGSMIYSTAIADLHPKTVSFDDIHAWTVADKLSAQEKALASSRSGSLSESSSSSNTNQSSTGHPEQPANGHPELVSGSFSTPKSYSKIRLPHIHSWAPVYFNYNSTSDISGDDYYETASLGATVLFQNLFGSGWGSLGYSYHKDPYTDDYVHSAHLNYTYTGLPPVIEISADYGDHDKLELRRTRLQYNDNTTSLLTFASLSDDKYWKAEVTTYLPLRFSSGGWSRGIIPQLKYEIENNEYDDDVDVLQVIEQANQETKYQKVRTIDVGDSHILQTLTPSLRGYILQSTPSSCIFPRLGIGLEAGYKFLPQHNDSFTSTGYLYSYGYLPGLFRTHGFRLTAAWQHQFSDEEWCFGNNAIDIYPRGFDDNGSLKDFMESYGKDQYRFTIDYAMPIALPFRSSLLSPLFYIKRLELEPFADFALVNLRTNLPAEFTLAQSTSSGTYSTSGINNLKFWSFGASLNLRLSNFLWLPFDSAIGVRVSYNTWDDPSGIVTNMLNPDHIHASFLFTVNM
jgi:hypothetical protein